MSDLYEVLNPWAESEPILPRGLAERLTDVNNKTIGLFGEAYKRAARPILSEVERHLKERYSGIKFTWFWSGTSSSQVPNLEEAEPDEIAKFNEWVKGVDGVVLAVGD